MVTVKESVPEHSMLQVPDWCDWSGSLHLETARNARSVGPLWPFDTPSVLLVGSAMKTTFPTAQKHEIGQRKSTKPHELSDRPRVEGGNMTAQKTL